MPTNITTAKQASPKTRKERLLRIMYSSVCPQPMEQTSLQELLAQCVRNNQRNGITGALMVDGRLIVQYIEGPEAEIRALWKRIEDDPRHYMVVQLYEEEGLVPRLFGQWSMLHGQASRSEMLGLIRNAYLESKSDPKPAWSLAIAPLVIMLDAKYSKAYAQALV
jgi:Sensors of blue-light using FAD